MTKKTWMKGATLALIAALALAGCSKKAGAQTGGSGGGASDFKYELNKAGDGVVIQEYIGKKGGKVVIPAKIEGYPVVEIGWDYDPEKGIALVFIESTDRAVDDWKERKENRGKKYDFGNGRTARITSVVIPDTVTVIAGFHNCTALKEITIPKSVKVIGNSAFSGCGLTSITIPEGVTYIGVSAFAYCDKLKSVTLPESLEKIGVGAFSNCSELATVKLPSHPIKYGKWDPFTGEFEEGLRDFEPVFDGCPKLSLATRKAITDSGYTGEF